MSGKKLLHEGSSYLFIRLPRLCCFGQSVIIPFSYLFLLDISLTTRLLSLKFILLFISTDYSHLRKYIRLRKCTYIKNIFYKYRVSIYVCLEFFIGKGTEINCQKWFPYEKH